MWELNMLTKENLDVIEKMILSNNTNQRLLRQRGNGQMVRMMILESPYYTAMPGNIADFAMKNFQ